MTLGVVRRNTHSLDRMLSEIRKENVGPASCNWCRYDVEKAAKRAGDSENRHRSSATY